MIDLTILENGNLRLSLEKDCREELEELREKFGISVVLHQALEAYWANGWYIGTANQLWQMSESPVICEEGYVEDNGSNTLHGKAWYFPNYMIEDEIETILEKGYVDFDFWQEFDNESFPSCH